MPAVYAALRAAGLATANIGLISDIIACPGMDYCALATARSIPVAQEIATRFDELKLEHEIGPLKIKISGCINACGHHHVGHIGILGLDRAGVENYQITLGGDGTENAAIGERDRPGFRAEEIVPAVERIVRAYLDLRDGAPRRPSSTLIAGSAMEPFKAGALPGQGRRSPMPLDASTDTVPRRCAERSLPRTRRDAVLERALTDGGAARSAWSSSFGAESVALLHLVSMMDRGTPVLFIDTRMLFAETLAYRRELAERLG